MHCLRAIRCYQGRQTTKYQDQRGHLYPQIYHICHQTQKTQIVWAVCHMQRDDIIRQAYKQDFKGEQKRERLLKRWSDQMRNDIGLPLLTEERNTTEEVE